ncbi:MAG: LacI family DNA-binding transcriptional regulator [Nocardioidaceae bacterium]
MGTRRRVTLADVARAAGVSTTTASYVVNGRQDMRISQEAHRRVQEAAAALGYRPNRNALSLRAGTTQTIGLITDFVAGGQYAGQMVSGASAACRAIDHLLLIGETEGDLGLEHKLIEEMVDRQVDGILYSTLVTVETAVPPALAGQRMVLVNCRDRGAAWPSVLPDEVAGGRNAAAALLSAGHREHVYLVGGDLPTQQLAGAQRYAGIVQRLDAAGASLAGVIACEWAVVPAYDAVSRFLASGARPEAMICLNDRVAMGAYQALEEAGLDVPGDVSVVSFDATELASWLRPTLTSVEVPYAELGRRAVQLLMEPGGPAPGVRTVPMPLRGGASIRAARHGRRREGVAPGA